MTPTPRWDELPPPAPDDDDLLTEFVELTTQQPQPRTLHPDSEWPAEWQRMTHDDTEWAYEGAGRRCRHGMLPYTPKPTAQDFSPRS